ncbi:hypothetical protein GCM10025783_10670 [Amnibacterium soli]|uniref:DUF4190 domain-containing protein n=1 Tax=Amnibacterium soli TaxID=1282736 RepID=A0ABP8YZ35_9MICO
MTDPFRSDAGVPYRSSLGRGPVIDPDAPRPNGFAVASLVLGVVGLAVGVIPLFIGLILSFLPTVLAILFGLIGLARTSTRRSGFVPALLGTLLGSLTAFLWTTGYGVVW